MSSLSDERIIRRLSRYFVPAWVSRDHYQLAAPPRRHVELLARMDADRAAKRLEGGTVCAFLAHADGTVLATLSVQKASKPDVLTAFLDRAIAHEKLTPRAPAVPSGPSEKAGPVTKDGRRFTVRTRFDGTGASRGTSRDVVELSREEGQAFLPPAEAGAGQRWAIPAATSEKLLRFAYPPLPHWEAKKARLTACELRAELATAGARSMVALHGRVAMVYPDLGKPTDGELSAKVVGYATAEAGALTSFVLVSEEGRYVWRWDGKPITKPISFAVELEP
ncbi:MAG: hypothetical protein U0797_16440 [Gemmataceae bacterium]